MLNIRATTPQFLADIQSGSQLLHSISSQFFPLSSIVGMGDHNRWRVDPHFDESAYTIMHNIMHNEHSAQMANFLLTLLDKAPVHEISNAELFPKSSDCGVHFNPILYRELELRTSGNDPQWHPTQGWPNKQIFWNIFHAMYDLALFKDNFARAASVKVDLVDEKTLERKALSNTWSDPP